MRDFTGVHGTPPFGKILPEHYMPAFRAAIDQARGDVQQIVSCTGAPTFANTIEALEFSGGRLDAISNIFFNLNEAETSESMQQTALEVSPLLTGLANDIKLDPVLFDRVKEVYQSRASMSLGREQERLLEKTYKGFVRGGAGLGAADKESFRRISTELSELSLRFNQNTLAATNAYYLHITDPDKVAELPEFVRQGAEEEARTRGLDGWVFTLQATGMVPFMTYSSKRELKEELWRKYNSRALGGEFDNAEIVKRIASLRMELAGLLGYDTYADLVLEERMAGSRGVVDDFLERLLGRGLDGARADLKRVTDHARTLGADFGLMPWDFAYYAEKLKEAVYDVGDELTKPYFNLEKAEAGIFALAGRLYGVTFRLCEDIELYHPDVRAFEVNDADGRFLAVLYMDYFPRSSKRSGAWMTEFRPQYVKDGEDVRPLISIVCNFTKPAAGMPSLLTFDEVNTLLHEFGHALHGIFAQGTYPSLTGTSVYRDFVELPSQIMENWALEKEFLDMWAEHYQTGEKIPAGIVDKLIAARNYNAAYAHVRQVSFGLGDMAWHSITAPVTDDVSAFEREAVGRARVLPFVEGECMATSFGHIFSGGYAAGYYGYKWAEVLEADAFSLFQQEGVFSSDVAGSFRRNILSKGGSEHPMELYRRFRGHEPDVDALFVKMGLK